MDRRPGGAPPIAAAVDGVVREHAAQWFDGPTPRKVDLRAVGRRPRAALYAVHLDDSPGPRLLAKVRLDGSPSGDGAPTRPTLARGALPVAEQTAREYAGLRAVHAIFGNGPDPRFATVRPLARLVAENTILMEYVDARTVRQLLTGQSRLLAPTTRRVGGDPIPWAAVGVWLRRFHDRMPLEEHPPRQSTRDEVVDRFHAYDDFLAGRLGARRFGGLGRAGAELAADVLPERLPLAVGHGDFAPRNAFVLDSGRVAVFDPLPRWAVPTYEDLARFVVGVRLLGIQLYSGGAAFSPYRMARWTDALVRGYFGDEPRPSAALRCYELLVMLDKWSALLDARGAGPRARLRAASLDRAAPYLLRRGRELLDDTTGETGQDDPEPWDSRRP
ncbi:MAG TPA: hypothetical protein VFZ64_10935 [Nocardioidaceae bacterium]